MNPEEREKLIIARAKVRDILDEFRKSAMESVDLEYAKNNLVDWHQAAVRGEVLKVLESIETAAKNSFEPGFVSPSEASHLYALQAYAMQREINEIRSRYQHSEGGE